MFRTTMVLMFFKGKERNNSLPLSKGAKYDSSKSSVKSAENTKKIARNHRCKRSFSSPGGRPSVTTAKRSGKNSSALLNMEALNKTAAEIRNHIEHNNRKSRPRHRELPKSPEKKSNLPEPEKPPRKQSNGTRQPKAQDKKPDYVKPAAGKTATGKEFVKTAAGKAVKTTPVKYRRHSELPAKKVETDFNCRPRSATKPAVDYKSRRKSEFKPYYIDKRYSSMGNPWDKKIFAPSTKVQVHKGSVEKKRSKSSASKHRHSSGNNNSNNNNNNWIKNNEDSCKLNHFALDKAKAKKMTTIKLSRKSQRKIHLNRVAIVLQMLADLDL